MKRLAAVLATSLALCGSAQADETGFELSKGFAIGGYVASGVGPLITIGSFFLAVDSAINTAEGDGSGRGILAGGYGMLIGVGITAVGPPLVVGSSIGGYLAVKDMGGSPSFVPAAVGIGGFGVQALGWVLTISAANKYDTDPEAADSLNGIASFVRFAGWTTELIAGGLQLSANGRAARSTLPRTPRASWTVVPTHNGGMMVGRF